MILGTDEKETQTVELAVEEAAVEEAVEEGTKADKRIGGFWLGCGRRGCGYWVHRKCLGLVATNNTPLRNVEFYCPKHII